MKRLAVCLWLLTLVVGTLPVPVQAELINGDLIVAGYINYCAASGATNTYACSLTPAIKQYRTGGCYSFKANTANTGSATLNLNSLGAKTIQKFVAGTGTNLVANDIGAGQVVSVCYDGTVMQVQSGSGGGVGSGTVTSVDGSGPMTGGPITSAGTFGFDSSLPAFLKDGGASDLTCGSSNGGKGQVMDNGEFQYCDGATTSVLHKGLPTQSGLLWNVTPATCTGDASSGKLTVNGSNQIVCAPDQGGAGGSGDITAVGTATTGDAFTDATPGQRLTYAPMAAPSTPASGKATVYVDSTSKNFAVKNDAGVVNHGLKSLAATTGLFVTGVEDDGDLLVAAPTPADVGLGNVDNTSDATKNAATATLTNHEVVPRSLTCTPSANHIIPNGNTTDVCESYSLSAGTTIDAPTLTSPHPYNHQRLVLMFKSAAPQTLTWNTDYSAECRLPLPRATTGDGTIYDRFVFDYNNTSAKWCLVASTAEPVPPRTLACPAVSNTITPNADTTDICTNYTLAAGTTIANPTGATPYNGKQIELILKSAAVQTLAWGTAYTAECNLPLPTATTGDGTTYDHFLVEYNATSGKWCPLSSSQTPASRVTTLTSSTTYTCPGLTSDACEMAMTGATGTLTVAAPTGTPRNGQMLRLGFLCTNSQTFSWNAVFVDSSTFTRPTTCPADTAQWSTVEAVYSTVTSKWQLVNGSVASFPATGVKTDQSNTYTGANTQNFGSNTAVILPKAAGAVPTADGDVRFDTTQHVPVYGENGLVTSQPTRTLFVGEGGSANNASGGTGDHDHTGTTVTLPANYLVQHRSLRVCSLWTFTTTSSAPTLVMKLKMGGVTILQTGSGGLTNSRTANAMSLCYLVLISGAVGASANTYAGPIGMNEAWATSPDYNNLTQPITIPTNAAVPVVLTSKWNTATSGNIVTPVLLTVEALN